MSTGSSSSTPKVSKDLALLVRRITKNHKSVSVNEKIKINVVDKSRRILFILTDVNLPLNYLELRHAINDESGANMKISFITTKGDMIMPIRNQTELLKCFDWYKLGNCKLKFNLLIEPGEPGDLLPPRTVSQPEIGVYVVASEDDLSTTGSNFSSRATDSGVPETPPISATLNVLELQRGSLIGRGSFGNVYRVRDSVTGIEYAQKVVELGRERGSHLEKQLRSLDVEISMLKTIQHPHIVRWYEHTETQEEISIIMEYMPGGSLRSQLDRYKAAFGEPLASSYTRQVLSALQYLHTGVFSARGQIVHRDVKCANILYDGRGIVKLGDFGTAKRHLSTAVGASGSMTSMATTVGTPYFMAPELLRGETYTAHVDIWAVGCTLVEMLTRFPPFGAFEPLAAIFKICEGQEIGYTLPRGTSSCVQNFLKLAMATTPADRPSAAALLEHEFCISRSGFSSPTD